MEADSAASLAGGWRVAGPLRRSRSSAASMLDTHLASSLDASSSLPSASVISLMTPPRLASPVLHADGDSRCRSAEASREPALSLSSPASSSSFRI